MSKLRVGVLGCGYMAQMAHIPALKSLENVDIAAVCDVRGELASEVARAWDIPKTFGTVEEFLKEDFDAVFVLTPVQCHLSNVKAALAVGKHVFCEKPAAMSAASVHELSELQKQAGKTVAVGYMKRHDMNLNYYRKLQAESDWGRLLFIRAHSFVGRHWNAAIGDLCEFKTTDDLPSFNANTLDPGPEWLDGARDQAFYSFDNPFYALLDTGCHTVNLMRYLAGDTPRVTVSRNAAGVRLADLNFADFNGSLEFCVNFRMYRWDEVTELYFENASVRILTPPPLDRQSSTVIEIYVEKGESKEVLTVQDNHQWAFRAQAASFAARTLNNEIFSDLDDAEKDLEIIEQIYRKETDQ